MIDPITPNKENQRGLVMYWYDLLGFLILDLEYEGVISNFCCLKSHVHYP